MCEPGEREQDARDGTAGGAQRRQQSGRTASPVDEREHRGDGERDAQRERQPPDPDVPDCRDGEPSSAPLRGSSVDGEGQPLEQRGGGQHRQGRNHPQAQHRGERPK